MSRALDELVALLDLEELEVNIFRGRSPEERSQRVFGGQVLGQALVAAGRTVPAGMAHSLHAYFLRPGDPSLPILYQVDRTRDGRTFTTRRVTAIQKGRAIFHLETSFQRPERGPEHQDAMPEAPDPESLPPFRAYMGELLARSGVPEAGWREWIDRDRPIDTRYVTPFDPFVPQKLPPRLLVWIRADGELPDAPIHHHCAVAYASDLTLLDTAMLPHESTYSDGRFQTASLDHAMWFHREFRADAWLLYVQESPAAAGARGFSTGRLFARDGRLVASVVQEGLIRPRRRT